MNQKILISACLMGEPVRYDGQDNAQKVTQWQETLESWQRAGHLIPICPEILGGLPTPRPAAEIQNADGEDVLNGRSRILTKDNDDVTDAFVLGTEKTLAIAKRHNAIAALLASRSPSCGSRGIYDGSFSGALKEGTGVTAALLERHGIRCFGPEDMTDMLDYIGDCLLLEKSQ